MAVTDSMDMSLAIFWETVKDRKFGVFQSMICKEPDTYVEI